MNTSRVLKIALPVVIIIVGIVISRALLVGSPKAHREPVVNQAPLVSATQVQPQDIRIPVYSQGTVQPSTSIILSSEVTGRIISVAGQFANGGFFKQGEALLRVNPSDYELAITKAEALVASANQQLAQAEAEYKQKLEEYKGVDTSKVSDFALRKPQYEEAKAKLKAAGADLDLAKVQRDRCTIRAPFDGRVVEKKADIGQYVTPGMMLASVYAIDIAEVRLPLSLTQVDLLNLPPAVGQQNLNNPVLVRLSGQVGGQRQNWDSRIVRSEATIDERNRQQYVVAQVKDPYGIHANNPAPALPTGLFVEAEIEGRLMKDIYVLPRTAIHSNDKVWLLDKEQRLRIRSVELLHRGENNAYVKSGLNPNDNVITTQLDAVVDGMQLRITGSATTSETRVNE